MAKAVARNGHDYTKMVGPICLFVLAFIQGSGAQRVKVEAEVVSYPGQPVNLRCAFSDATGIQLTQVSWIYEPKDGERMNIAVFHPNFGANYPASPVKGRVGFTTNPPSLQSPSIQITDVKMTDEGKYICEFATYPSGNEQGITSLIMLAKPQNSASVVTVIAGTTPVVVARCDSVAGRPAADIAWVTAANGNASTTSQTGVDNTVTVNSVYKLVPTPADNGKDISCVVSHRTQGKPESFPMQLAVEYPPQVSVVGYDNNWYVGRTNVVLTCEASGNPIPTMVTWKSLSGQMPDTVQIEENKLKVLKVDDSVNGTFFCEVQNRLGVGKDQITTMVRGTRLPEKGPATGSIIGAIIGVIILLAIIGSAIAMYRKRKQNVDGPPKHKPPPPNRINNSTDRLNTSRDPVAEDRPVLQNQYYTSLNTEDEPVTNLDSYHDEVTYDSRKKEEEEGDHHHSADPSAWEAPEHDDTLPPYFPSDQDLRLQQEPPQATPVNRGDSFVSPAMYV